MEKKMMTGEGDAPMPESPSLVGKLYKGVYPLDPHGRMLQLAIVDEAGNIIRQGDAVSREAWKATLEAYWKHLQDLGVMRVHTEPPGRVHSSIGKAASASKS